MTRRPQHVRRVARLVRERRAVEQTDRVDRLARVQLVHALDRLVRQQPEHRAGEVAGVEALDVRGGADADGTDLVAPLALADAQAGEVGGADEAAGVAVEEVGVEDVDPAAVRMRDAERGHRGCTSSARRAVRSGGGGYVTNVSRPPSSADMSHELVWKTTFDAVRLIRETARADNSPKQVTWPRVAHISVFGRGAQG